MKIKPKTSVPTLTFARFRAINVHRCGEWHRGGVGDWDISEWLVALMGEVGELASLVKMQLRERDQLPGNKFTVDEIMIEDEIADIFMYLDLIAEWMGSDWTTILTRKFNETSRKVGLSQTILPEHYVFDSWLIIEDEVPTNPEVEAWTWDANLSDPTLLTHVTQAIDSLIRRLDQMAMSNTEYALLHSLRLLLIRVEKRLRVSELIPVPVEDEGLVEVVQIHRPKAGSKWTRKYRAESYTVIGIMEGDEPIVVYHDNKHHIQKLPLDVFVVAMKESRA